MIQSINNLVQTVAGIALEDPAIKGFFFGWHEDFSGREGTANFPVVWMTPPVKPAFNFRAATFNNYLFDLVVLSNADRRESGVLGLDAPEALMDRLLFRLHKWAKKNTLAHFEMKELGPEAYAYSDSLQGWIVTLEMGEKFPTICDTPVGSALSWQVIAKEGATQIGILPGTAIGRPGVATAEWDGDPATLQRALGDLLANWALNIVSDSGTLQVLLDGLVWRGAETDSPQPSPSTTSDFHTLLPIYL